MKEKIIDFIITTVVILMNVFCVFIILFIGTFLYIIGERFIGVSLLLSCVVYGTYFYLAFEEGEDD